MAVQMRRLVGLVAVVVSAGCGGSGARGEDNSAAASAPVASLSDAEIAAVVVAANEVDADLGDFAAERATSKLVQEFARAMSRDHRAVNENAGALVSKLGVIPVESELSRSLREDAATVRASLRQQSASEFDRAYLTREVAYHEAVIEVVDSVLLPHAQHAELKQAIANVRPALVAHLQHAEHLLRGLQ